MTLTLREISGANFRASEEADAINTVFMARTNETPLLVRIGRHNENKQARFPQKSAKNSSGLFRGCDSEDDGKQVFSAYSESRPDRTAKPRYCANGKPCRIGWVYGNLG